MKLTIITINYNNLRGLQRTIDSIVNQTFTDYEWIVVDGGSTDGSKEILEKYQDHFSWWCSEPDKGVYNAMNKGIKHATGEYINFMNSGDCFASPSVLKEIFNKPHTADILFGQMAVESIQGEKVNIPTFKTHLCWWELYPRGLGHQSEFAKRALFDERMFDESFRIAADWDWNTYFIASKRVTTEYIPCIVSVYEGGGMSDKQYDQLNIERAIIHNRYFASLREEDISEMRYVSVIKSYKLTRAIYYLMTRMANRYRKLKRC